MQKESYYQRKIINYLTKLEEKELLLFQRTNNTAIYDPARGRFRAMAKGQKKGFPDIMVFTKGKALGLEVKTPIGRQSKDQKEMQTLMERQGAGYAVVVTVEDVTEALERIWRTER